MKTKEKEVDNMNENITVDVLEIDGKDFILIDKIDKYYFFSEENNPENVCILKEVVEDEEELLVSLDDDAEVDKDFDLIEEKYKNNKK